MQGHFCLAINVALQNGSQIRAAQHITIEDHCPIKTQVGGHVADAATGSQWLIFHHVFNVQPVLGAIAEELLKDLSLERGAQYHVLHACGLDARQQVLKEREASGGQHRLGDRVSQRAQSRSLTANQNDSIGVGCEVLSHAYSQSFTQIRNYFNAKKSNKLTARQINSPCAENSPAHAAEWGISSA